MTKYVSGLYFTADSVILIKKSHPDWQKGFCNLPGGAVKEGESALDAITREWKEEVCQHTYGADWFPRIEIEGMNFHHTIFQWRYLPIQVTLKSGRKDEPVAWYRLAETLIPHIYRPKVLGLPPLLPDLYWIIPMAMDQNIQGIIQLKDRR